ncbi:RNA chaperone Hfq [Leisingera caerulea]|uniref:RNA chaperone Hfq n=1 Tax=Leisingera caerulea TaxID=506591 RepID=UPI0003F9EFD7|nr:RNA chaperone Hfq [Leisingera caerulea]
MAEKTNALQDGFLTALELQKVPATVFLVNGVRLQGHVVRHDRYSLALQRAEQTQIVLKSSISTIMSNDELTL